MTDSPDVLVVGGGIIGLTSAYLLAKGGRRVTLIDRGEMGREASWAGAGILPPGNVDRAATPLDRLRAWSVGQFPALSAELRSLTGIDNGYVKCGGIEVLDDGDEDAPDLWRAEGLNFGEARSDEVDGLRLPPDRPAYFIPDFAQVRNPRHLRALVAACERLGVTLSPHTAFHRAMLTPCRQCVIAAGAWANELLPLVPVRPVRGQMVLFRCDRPPLAPVVLYGKRYLVPRADGRVLAGSTEEPEAGFEKANTPEGVDDLKRFAFALCPALRQAEVEATWAGLRPGSPDGLPFIGPLPEHANVVAAVGHFRAGIQLSVGTARLVCDLINGVPPTLDVEPFRPDRPPAPPQRSAFRS